MVSSGDLNLAPASSHSVQKAPIYASANCGIGRLISDLADVILPPFLVRFRTKIPLVAPETQRRRIRSTCTFRVTTT
jgi:hypothetical protein